MNFIERLMGWGNSWYNPHADVISACDETTRWHEERHRQQFTEHPLMASFFSFLNLLVLLLFTVISAWNNDSLGMALTGLYWAFTVGLELDAWLYVRRMREQQKRVLENEKKIALIGQ